MATCPSSSKTASSPTNQRITHTFVRASGCFQQDCCKISWLGRESGRTSPQKSEA
jgi:hypothetical protein